MKVFNYGAGIAPDVDIRNGEVYVAWTVGNGSHLNVYRAAGNDWTLAEHQFFTDASYPRFGGDWLVWKQYPTFAPTALNLVTGNRRTFPGLVVGDPGVVVSDATGEIVWQTLEGVGDGRAYRVFADALIGDRHRDLGLVGAPDGLDALSGASHVICRKDIGSTFTDVGSFVQQSGDARVGQYGYGIGLRLDGWSEAHWLLGGSDTKDPRAAMDSNIYAFVSWGGAGVRLVIATRSELVALPVVPSITPVPTVVFSFNHPVLVAPYKDPNGLSGAPAEIVVNERAQSVSRPYFVAQDSLGGPFRGARLGVYSEDEDPAAVIRTAAALKTRLLLCHDAPTPWTLPKGLRPWDIPGIELYLDRSPAAWTAAVIKLLADWPGDIAVTPSFYCGGGAPPNERWTVDEVLAGLSHLSAIVNLSPRIKLICPFEFDRANGITAHPPLRVAHDALLRAAAATGEVSLHQIDQEAPVVPKITIARYDPVLQKGHPWSVDALIGDTDVTVRIGGDGNLTIHAKNPAGEDATGKPRYVEVKS